MISLIVAQSENRVIGRDNQLPWHIPADLKHFKTMTLGKPVIMGRKTFESIGRPLPGRDNIVISRSGFSAPGVVTYASLDEAIARTKAPEIMIIGGAQVYAQALPLADTLYITLVHKNIEGDAMFPEIDKASWKETAREDHPAQGDQPAFSFITLKKSL